MFAALRELFARVCDQRVVIAMVDDIQWADDDSLALLSALLRSPDPPPVAFVASVRPEATEEVLVVSV